MLNLSAIDIFGFRSGVLSMHKTVPGTILSLVFVAIVVSTVMDGNSFGPLIGPSSLVLVLAGSFGAVLDCAV